MILPNIYVLKHVVYIYDNAKYSQLELMPNIIWNAMEYKQSVYCKRLHGTLLKNTVGYAILLNLF